MRWTELKINGLKLISPRLFEDERGIFFESYQEMSYLALGIGPFAQDNISFSKKGTVRALHFQSDPGQDKLVSCIEGEIWDVAVDIRADSPTFMQWEAVILDDRDRKQLFIPKGFAHGFCVLSERAYVHYKVSAPYNAKTECSIRWNDPDLKIAWPIREPLLSSRDRMSPFLKEVMGVLGHR